MTTREEIIRLVEALPEDALDRARSLLETLYSPSQLSSQEERKALLSQLRGSTAYLGFTTKDLHQQKQEEIDREEDRFARLHANQQ